MLTLTELAGMRATAARVMVEAASVLRNTPASDGAGGETEAWTTAGTYACELEKREAQAGEAVEAEKLAALTHWEIRFPVGTDVRVRDRISLGGRTYEVNDLDTGKTFALCVTAKCRRMD